MTARILKITPGRAPVDAIDAAARIITDGGVVVFPTRGLYGLGADAFNETAINRIFNIKGRSTQKPVLVLIDEIGHLERLVKNITPLAQRVMSQFWPGRITLVFHALDAVPPMLTAGTGKIGVRMAGHPVGIRPCSCGGRTDYRHQCQSGWNARVHVSPGHGPGHHPGGGSCSGCRTAQRRYGLHRCRRHRPVAGGAAGGRGRGSGSF